VVVVVDDDGRFVVVGAAPRWLLPEHAAHIAMRRAPATVRT
jgi:hypothetical protein